MAPDQLDRLEHIVRDYSAALVRTLTFVVFDGQVAADIAQETFVKLYLHWDSVSKHPDVRPWIYRVAINRAKDHRRAATRASRLLKRLSGEAVVAERSARWQPDVEFIDALKSLPQRQRVAAALYYVADLPVTEVGELMGITEGAASAHLHRAREALKGLLEDGR